jgi:hypothetical protein
VVLVNRMSDTIQRTRWRLKARLEESEASYDYSDGANGFEEGLKFALKILEEEDHGECR